jgi:precorrin-2/cobalt-factor-2 C20-methyltransferase
MKEAKLYGVGVGPGAPDLMTLRAVNVLSAVDVIAIPRRSEFDRSVAWEIARPNVPERPEQEKLYLNFPMTKDPERLRPAWDIAFGEIGKRLDAGRSVAFITEGDPFVYSTFIYLFAAALERWPQVPVEVVPAVSSLTAVPMSILTPIADGQERVAVLPASYGLADLPRLLDEFDTLLLMKVSSVMPELCRILEDKGLIDRAIYVSKATTPQQKIVRDLRTIKNDRCDYFSMVVVSRRARAGVLRGEA